MRLSRCDSPFGVLEVIRWDAQQTRSSLTARGDGFFMTTESHLRGQLRRLERNTRRFVKPDLVTAYTDVKLPVSMRLTFGLLFLGGAGFFQTIPSLVAVEHIESNLSEVHQTWI